MDIILYLLQLIQYQHKQICWLLNFICRYIHSSSWLSMIPAPARVVMHQNRSSTRTTVPNDNSCARFAMPGSHLMKADFPL